MSSDRRTIFFADVRRPAAARGDCPRDRKATECFFATTNGALDVKTGITVLEAIEKVNLEIGTLTVLISRTTRS